MFLLFRPSVVLLKRVILVSMLVPLMSAAGSRARAAGGEEGSENASSARPAENEKVDDLVTNNQLRALSGSTSKWSVSSIFSYNGGSVDQPFSEDRPNITAATGTIVKSLLDGQVSLKYNVDVKNSLLAGIGLRWIAPLKVGGPSHYSGSTFDTDNPYLQYQYVYKWLGIQSVLQLTATKFTNVNLVHEGYDGQLFLDQENMYEIGKTGISVGASVSMQYQWFNKTGPIGSVGSDDYLADARDDQANYSFAFYPELEYQITDKINFRTLLGLWSYEHIRSASSANTYFHDKIYQSVGLGFSVTRDIFLYPNIQFLPDDIKSRLTNVGLTATINVF